MCIFACACCFKSDDECLGLGTLPSDQHIRLVGLVTHQAAFITSCMHKLSRGCLPGPIPESPALRINAAMSLARVLWAKWPSSPSSRKYGPSSAAWLGRRKVERRGGTWACVNTKRKWREVENLHQVIAMKKYGPFRAAWLGRRKVERQGGREPVGIPTEKGEML